MRSVVGRPRRCAKGRRLMAIPRPSPALRGRDIEPSIEPRITHEQITTSDKPSRKVLGTDSLHLHLGGSRGSTRRKDGCWADVGRGRLGPCRSKWARARAQEKCTGRWLCTSRRVSLPLHGTRVCASAQAGAGGRREAGGGGSPSPTAGEHPSRRPCLQSSRCCRR